MDKMPLLLRELGEHPLLTQRELARKMDISLGSVNALMGRAQEEGLIQKQTWNTDCPWELTPQGLSFLKGFQADRGVIMAAGFGSRFVPLTFETPKGLLKVFGERMIERQICQLRQAGIFDIWIVVGYLKEHFEYLIDKYQVKLLYNPEYSQKNTLATLYHARALFYEHNTYLLSSDNWLRENMYHLYEPYSWYSAAYMEGPTSEWCLTCNRKKIITRVEIGGADSYVMYGPVYLTREFSQAFLPEVEKYYHRPGTEHFYWEQVLMDCINHPSRHPALPELFAWQNPRDQVYEFENLEELRRFDPSYKERSGSEAMALISRIFQVPESQIRDLRTLKAGMTNQSFLFSVYDTHYICRIPGPGTDVLINRAGEYASYQGVKALGITEEILFFDPDHGYKISRYYENSHNADPTNMEEMAECMALLRRFHESKIHVDHAFDLRERIDCYEILCRDSGGISFEDYEGVKKQMEELLSLTEASAPPRVLCHIDCVADNFIFTSEGLKLIDWEYAGMADPLLDIAMCAIYSYYTKEEAIQLLTIYLQHPPSPQERVRLYAYMALGGFLWALWTVYKANKGQEFGEYSLKMYRYAKEFYIHSMEESCV